MKRASVDAIAVVGVVVIMAGVVVVIVGVVVVAGVLVVVVGAVSALGSSHAPLETRTLSIAISPEYPEPRVARKPS